MTEAEDGAGGDAVDRVLRGAKARAAVARFGAARPVGRIGSVGSSPGLLDATAEALRGRADTGGDTFRDGDQLDREERTALRRVAGLSTELQDVTEVEYRQLRLENVVLIGVYPRGGLPDAEKSLPGTAAPAGAAGCGWRRLWLWACTRGGASRTLKTRSGNWPRSRRRRVRRCSTGCCSENRTPTPAPTSGEGK